MVKNSAANVPIRLADIATIAPSVAPVYTIVTANGKPAVLLNVFRQPDGNTVAVAEGVAAELAQIRQTLPPSGRGSPR